MRHSTWFMRLSAEKRSRRDVTFEQEAVVFSHLLEIDLL